MLALSNLDNIFCARERIHFILPLPLLKTDHSAAAHFLLNFIPFLHTLNGNMFGNQYYLIQIGDGTCCAQLGMCVQENTQSYIYFICIHEYTPQTYRYIESRRINLK